MKSKKIHIFSRKNVNCMIRPANSFTTYQIVRENSFGVCAGWKCM